MSLAYAHANLRYNPFGTLDRDAWIACGVVDLQPIIEVLATPRPVVQLLGDQGRGKTTHLLALAARVQGAVYVRAFSDAPATLPPCDVLLLDEADAWWPWRRVVAYRHARAVVIATHRDLSREITLSGRKPHVFLIRGLDEERLQQALDRRIERARRDAGPVPRIPAASVRALLSRHGDDLRAVERTLYERFQALTEARDVIV